MKVPLFPHIEGQSVRLVTPDQYREGYVVQRGIGDFDRKGYRAIKVLDDGNILVHDPAPLNQKL